MRPCRASFSHLTVSGILYSPLSKQHLLGKDILDFLNLNASHHGIYMLILASIMFSKVCEFLVNVEGCVQTLLFLRRLLLSVFR